MSAKSAVQMILPLIKTRIAAKELQNCCLFAVLHAFGSKFVKQKMFCGCSGQLSQLNVCPSSKKTRIRARLDSLPAQFQIRSAATIYQLSASSADMNKRKTAKQKINNANPLVKKKTFKKDMPKIDF